MKFLQILIVFGIGFVVFVRYLESRSIYYPSRDISFTPEDVGLSFEDVQITTEDHVNIHGWFLPRSGARATILFFHGNAGNIADRIGKLMMFHNMGLNVLIIDYRGYGKSEGRPAERGLYLDAKAAYDFLVEKKRVAPQHIVLYGASLGGAVAVDLAARRDVGAIIIDSSFTSAADMAKRIYPFVPGFLLKTKFDSIRKIKTVKAPKLFIHSREDDIVPYGLGQKLFDAASAPKMFLTIRGNHNDSHETDKSRFIDGIQMFLQKEGVEL